MQALAHAGVVLTTKTAAINRFFMILFAVTKTKLDAISDSLSPTPLFSLRASALYVPFRLNDLIEKQAWRDHYSDLFRVKSLSWWAW